MRTTLYQAYTVAVLIETVEDGILQWQKSDFNSPVKIKMREEALRVVSSYSRKDIQGKPLQQVLTEEQTNALIDVDLTPKEAAELGIATTTISLLDLQRIARAQTTLWMQKERQKKKLAAHIVAHGSRRYERLNSVVTDINIKYAHAAEAFNILSSPADGPMTQVTGAPNIGSEILEELKSKYTLTSSILLTKNEFDALRSGFFDKIDCSTFSTTEQESRLRVNLSVDHIYENVDRSIGPVGVFCDSKRMGAVEKIMRIDSTASWLLNAVKQQKLPVIFCKYEVPDNVLAKRAWTLATYVDVYSIRETLYLGLKSVRRNRSMEYIKLFTNLMNNNDIVASYAHEARHFWQAHKLLDHDRESLSSIDIAVRRLLCEADARAIEGKVTWSIRNKTGQSGHYSYGWQFFEKSFSRFSSPNLSHSGKVRKATQESFIKWLEEELTRSAYLNVHLRALVGEGKTVANWIQTLSESPYLGTEYLAKLSQVASVHYIDEEGARRIKKLFMDKLPHVIAGHRISLLNSDLKHG